MSGINNLFGKNSKKYNFDFQILKTNLQLFTINLQYIKVGMVKIGQGGGAKFTTM